MPHLRERILRNGAHCHGCNRHIESRKQHTPETCTCRDVTLDGGHMQFILLTRPSASYTLERETEMVPCTGELEDFPFGRICHICGFEEGEEKSTSAFRKSRTVRSPEYLDAYKRARAEIGEQHVSD